MMLRRISFLLLLITAAFSGVEAVNNNNNNKANKTAVSSRARRSFPFQYVLLSGVTVEPLHRVVGPVRPNDRVSFHALTHQQRSDINKRQKKKNDTYILTNIVDTGRKHHVSRQPIYEAVVVDPRQWQSQLDWNRSNDDNKSMSKMKRFVPFCHAKTLWCVHDGGTSAREWFRQCSQYRGKSNYTIVPVIWPAEDKTIRSYLDDDMEVPPAAAEVFRPLLQTARLLQCKPSILCHGMGSYVLKLAAASLPRHSSQRRNYFDNIFLVAAHIRHDLFDSVRNKSERHIEQNHGKRIGALVQQKVHNLYSTRDLALSRHLPWQPALGRHPVHPQKLSKDLRHQVVNHNCNAFNHWHWKTNRLWHHYLFHKDALQYYESAAR